LTHFVELLLGFPLGITLDSEFEADAMLAFVRSFYVEIEESVAVGTRGKFFRDLNEFLVFDSTPKTPETAENSSGVDRFGHDRFLLWKNVRTATVGSTTILYHKMGSPSAFRH
jgi:hypothetical protein